MRLVYQASHAVKIPVIGMGGIATADDAIEFLLAGASAIAIGAMNFANPYTTIEVIDSFHKDRLVKGNHPLHIRHITAQRSGSALSQVKHMKSKLFRKSLYHD